MRELGELAAQLTLGGGTLRLGSGELLRLLGLEPGLSAPGLMMVGLERGKLPPPAASEILNLGTGAGLLGPGAGAEPEAAGLGAACVLGGGIRPIRLPRPDPPCPPEVFLGLALAVGVEVGAGWP